MVEALRGLALIASTTLAFSTHAEVFAGDAAACAKRLTAMESLFREADTAPDTSSFLPVSPDFQPVSLDANPVKDPFSALLEVGPSSARFDGRVIPGDASDSSALLAGIGRELDVLRAAWRTLHPKQRIARQQLGVWFDGRLPAADVWPIVQELSRSNDVLLLGQKPRAPAGRTRADLSEEVNAIRRTSGAADKAALISKAAARSMAGCSGHEKYFGAPAATMTDLRRSTLAAVKGCACIGVNFGLIEAIVVPELELPVVVAKAVRPEKSSKTVVKLPRGAKAGDLLAKLPLAGTATIRWEKAS